MPAPAVGVAVAIVIEVLVGGMLLVGWKARLAALVFAGFLLVSAFGFHNYWASPADQQMLQHINFYKNCAIASCLLFVHAFGPGRCSMDERSRTA